tara:strand:+ start:1107 stop:2177 length:1071 start_codon:yes stop_codon:yes gene_type:complete
MSQIQCPVCTLNNSRSNTNCDICDSLLVPGSEPLENNPIEDEFMQLTGSSRSEAREYLSSTSNNLETAISYFYNDREMGINNSQYVASQVFQFISNAIRTSYEQPNDVDDLLCQYLYRIGINKPHYCVICDSKAYLLSIKLISSKDSIYNFIRVFRKEDLIKLSITEEKYNDFKNEIIDLINKKYMPKIITNLLTYFKEAKTNKEKILKNKSLDQFNEIMNSRNGPNFRIIWDTIFQYDQNLPNDQIEKSLKNLVESSIFHNFINNSWDTPIYNHPASKEIISNLKTFKLEKDCEEFKELKETNCSICMQEFLEDGREVTSLGCHIFCKDCIKEWLEKHNDTCPICRNTISISKDV